MTKENEQKKYLGWHDSPLSKKGKEQLIALSKQRYPTPNLLFSSDLLRCRETAQILYPNKEYECSSLLREFHFGDWDCKTYDELKDDEHYKKWLQNPEKVTPPNGEAFPQFAERVMRGWQQVLRYFDNDEIKHIVIIAHGGVLRLLLHHFADEVKNFWEWVTPYGQGYELSGTRKSIRRGERCISLQVVPLTENYNG